MKKQLWIVMLVWVTVFVVRAQDNPLPPLEPITVENAGQIQELKRYGNGTFESPAWSPDGKTLAVGGSLGIWIYDTQNWKSEPRLIEMPGATKVGYSANGQVLGVTVKDQLHLLDTATFKELRVVEAKSVWAFNPDNQSIAVAEQNHVVLQEIYSGKQLKSFRLPGIYQKPTDITFDTVTDSLVANWISDDGECSDTEGPHGLWVWNLRDGNRQDASDFFGLDDSFSSATLSPNGSVLASSEGEEIVLYDTHGDKPNIHLEVNDYIFDTRFSPDGKLLVLSGDQGTSIWDVTTGEEITPIKFGQSHEFSFDDKFIATTSGIWDIATEQPVMVFRQKRFEMSPNGTTLIEVPENQQVRRLLDTPSGAEKAVLENVNNKISFYRFSPDSHWLATKYEDGSIKLWDTTTGDAHLLLEAPQDNLGNLVVFSPDSRLLLAGGSQYSRGELRFNVWDTRHLQLISPDKVMEHCGDCSLGLLTPYFTPQNAIIFSVTPTLGLNPTFPTFARFTKTNSSLSKLDSAFEGVYLWYPLTNTVQEWLNDAPDPDIGLDFSPSGQLAVYAINREYEDNEVHVVRVENGEAVAQIDTSVIGAYVDSVSFEMDEYHISFSTDDGMCSIVTKHTWDLQSNSEIPSERDEHKPVFTTFSADKSIEVSLEADGVTLTDISSGKRLSVLPASSYYASFTPDGAILLTQSNDGTVRLWGVPQSSP